MKNLFAAVLVTASLLVAPAWSQTLLTEKKTFEIPSFTTQSGRTLKGVKVGWESYGTLNADKSNAILICHFFSGNSHAAGKYKETDAAPGYWDAIVGPGKAIDTNKYFVLSSDTLVNLNTGDPNTITTGPATINPDTGKPYGMDFPIVTIRDFIEVQKKAGRKPRHHQAPHRHRRVDGRGADLRMGGELPRHGRPRDAGDRLR